MSSRSEPFFKTDGNISETNLSSMVRLRHRRIDSIIDSHIAESRKCKNDLTPMHRNSRYAHK